MIFNWELELSSLIKVVKIEAWNSGSCDLKSLSLGQALTDYKSTNKNFSLSLVRNNNNKY